MRSVFTWAVIIFVLFSCKEKKDEASDNVAISKLMTSYNEAFSKSDWPAVIKLVHPVIFKYISRKEFEKGLNSGFKGDDFEIRVRNTTIDSIFPVIQEGTRKYSLVLIKLTANMLLADSSDKGTLNQRLTQICEGMKGEFGKDFISCEVKENQIEFATYDRCYTIYLPKEKKWFVLSKDEDSEEIVNKIIPEEVRLKLGY